MKSFFKNFLCLVVLFIFENSAYSRSNNQTTEICQQNRRASTCIKNLKLKKYDLLKGNQIDIPVIPFKK